MMPDIKPNMMPDIKPKSALCKANSFPTVLSLQSLKFLEQDWYEGKRFMGRTFPRKFLGRGLLYEAV